jgi:hypothetical protein
MTNELPSKDVNAAPKIHKAPNHLLRKTHIPSYSGCVLTFLGRYSSVLQQMLKTHLLIETDSTCFGLSTIEKKQN